jgi:uncharacterized membrane protein YhaH (DUF805 family)
MKKWLGFKGRIGRAAFWWTLILSSAAFIVLFVFLDSIAGHRSTLILYPPFFWIAAAAAVKRMRDRAKSPMWLLVALVPVLGPLWLFLDLGLLRGTPGENHYGPDPLAPEVDYLTVKIDKA